MELGFVLVLALVVLGPDRMLGTARVLGKVIRDVRRTTEEVTRSLSLDEEPLTSSQETIKDRELAQQPEGSKPRDSSINSPGSDS
jgi:Sec-independent protein translocase protein TatA